MNIEKYDLETLLLAAIKSEVESKNVYRTLSNRVKNALLKERLLFLAGEEEKHQSFLESLYRQKIGKDEIILPESTPVPLPQVDPSEDRLLSEIVEDAMRAELAARDFYESLRDRFQEDEETKKMLQILASMEQGHYDILAKELENIKNFENYDSYWPMMHAGP